MSPLFTWWDQQPGSMELRDKRQTTAEEDRFYAEYGALSIKARVRKSLEFFAVRNKIEKRDIVVITDHK